MSRPKKEISVNVKECIENAFWSQMEKGTYKDITIKSLAIEAGVNRNTVYYYYDSVADVARKTCERYADGEATLQIMRSILKGDRRELLNNPQTMSNWRKARLFAKDDSPYIKTMFQTKLRNNWCLAMGIEYDTQPEYKKMELDFIFAGLVELIGSDMVSENPSKLLEFLEGDLGKGIIKTMNSVTC